MQPELQEKQFFFAKSKMNVNEQIEVEAKSWGTNSLEQETNLEKVFALNNFPVKQQQILES